MTLVEAEQLVQRARDSELADVEAFLLGRYQHAKRMDDEGRMAPHVFPSYWEQARNFGLAVALVRCECSRREATRTQ